MRKLFSLFLALVATTSLWAHDFEVDGIYYNYLEDNNVAVTYKGNSYNDYSNEYSGEVAIPSTVTNNGTTYSVTSIGWSAFENCSDLTSVTIGNSVTSIGDAAFSGCSSLTSVTIPNSVTNFGDYAFRDCSSLTSITIPNSVTSIGDAAFNRTGIYNNESNWEDNVLYIDNCLIEANTSISGSYTIKENTRLIAAWAFDYCSSLTSIIIPNSVTSIGDAAFSGCSSLTSIVVENGNTTYDSRENCNAIIETATNALINGCRNTFIPNSVTSIGDRAFYGCSSLTSITIPNSVTSIGSYAFGRCYSLTSLTIGNSVTSIGDAAFWYCSSLTSVTIPEGVTSIGGSTFSDCSSLTSVTIPNSVTSIGNRAFYDCSSLTSITIPNSVTSIGDYAFSSCIFAKENFVNHSVLDAEENDYWGATIWDTEIDGLLIRNDTVIDCRPNVTFVIIPNSVTSIGSSAFSSCSKLTSVTIPNSVTSIGSSAFHGCSSLTSITIPESVMSIGSYAFHGCSSLTSITCEAIWPPQIGAVGGRNGTFDNSHRSIPVYVPCGSENAYKAAYGWKDFTNIQEPLAEYSIQVSTSNSQMGTAIVNYNSCAGNQITATANYGYHFVQWSDGVTDNSRTITLTQDTILTAEFALTIAGQCGKNLYWVYDTITTTLTITGRGDMYNERPWGLFANDITKVQLPYGITHIGNDAFSECLNLQEITIPATVTSIGDQSFAGCRNLRNINCYPLLPPYAVATSFANYNVNLNVPCDYLEDYQYDIVFGSFKYINCMSSDEVEDAEDVEIDAGTTDVTIIWPTKENAYTYTIVIKKNGQVVCTLVFDAFGRLLNISFVPGRNGNHPAQYAEAVANGGFRFTVTGLEEGTDYTYDITVKDASNKTINSHSGKFTTESLTAVDNITTNNANIQKILRNGQLIIVRDGIEYNAMGQEL